MSDEKLVHSQSVEGLFVKALSNRITPACHESLKAAGLDLEQPLAPHYSVDQWRTFLRIAAESVYAGVPAEAAYFSMGERLVDGYFETFSGMALLGLLKLAGPGVALSAVGRFFKSATNFCEVQLVERGEQHVELTLSHMAADLPTFAAGAITRTLERVGATRATAVPERFDGTACAYDVRWSTEAVAASKGAAA